MSELTPLQTETQTLLEENFKLKFLKQGPLTIQELEAYDFARENLKTEQLVVLRKECYDKIRAALNADADV